ncbi:hypothetical protein SI65_00469 [Aspergillus cristatus]|uniref:NYN domain-containing protein n=1 Tax=Aspergillus cristatus TaxID=573508 RepID=A0A1E3BPJ0_ASPCR|nr:hypothetical protein SI65_00469 [Aspergillus cristatus]
MPASITSNWEFTPVINLLRSPAYTAGDSSAPSRHSEDHVTTPPAEELKDVNNDSGCAIPKNTNNVDTATPKLGDFGSLWDFLGQGTAVASATTIAAEDPQDSESSSTTPHPRSPQPSTPIKILQRPSPKPLVPEVLNKDRSSTSRRILVPKSRKNKREVGVESGSANEHNTQKATLEATSSDSTAESDGIFDPPLSKKGGVASSAQPAKSELYDSPPSSFDELDGALTSETIKKSPESGVIRVQSNVYKSADERRDGLHSKLLKKFPDYAGIVSGKGSSPRPVHVFVDISNIMVGFHDSVKVSRNIPIGTRIRRLPLSFKNFSLILERDRPAAKRVLVGSDRFAAIDEGEKLGYETNILDRVHKAKQITRRQVKSRKNARTASQEATTSSETNEVAAQRWVEQGVDEILHLKILESLLDTDEPATIVLATGDAAEAEYSGGFMKMVERALQRGWTVELVSFSQVTSQAYRRKEFRSKWGNRFRVIALDDYIEELLAM